MFRTILVVAAVGLGIAACAGPAAPAAAPVQTEESKPQAPELSEANHRAAAVQLLERMNMDEVIDTMIESSTAGAAKMVPNGAASVELMSEMLRESLDPDAMMNDFVLVYMRHFTQRELEELNAFYGTALGQKLIAKLPELTREGAELAQRRMQERMPELQAKMHAKMMEQLKNGAPQPRDAAPEKEPPKPVH